MIKKNFPSYDYLHNQEIMQFYQNFEKKEIFESSFCADCGLCCKRSGCMFFIEDFESMKFLDLIKQMDEGNISITASMNIQSSKKSAYAYPILYMRIRNQERGVIDLLSHRTPCSVLTKDGCPYSLEERPLGAIMQIPTKKGEKFWDCHTNTEARIIAVEHWKKYQNVLTKLVKYYTNHTLSQELAVDVARLIEILGTKIAYGISLTEEDKELLNMMKYFPVEYYQIAKENPNNMYLCLKASELIR